MSNIGSTSASEALTSLNSSVADSYACLSGFIDTRLLVLSSSPARWQVRAVLKCLERSRWQRTKGENSAQTAFRRSASFSSCCRDTAARALFGNIMYSYCLGDAIDAASACLAGFDRGLTDDPAQPSLTRWSARVARWLIDIQLECRPASYGASPTVRTVLNVLESPSQPAAETLYSLQIQGSQFTRDLSALLQTERPGDTRGPAAKEGLAELPQGAPYGEGDARGVRSRVGRESQLQLLIFLGGADLADSLGVHPSQRGVFKQRLQRWRNRHRGRRTIDWEETLEPAPNRPRFRYRVEAVRALADGLDTARD